MNNSFVLISASTAILFRRMHGKEKHVTVWFGLSKDISYETYSFAAFKQEMNNAPHQFALADISWEAPAAIKISFSQASLSTKVKNLYFKDNIFIVEQDTAVPIEIMVQLHGPKEFIFRKGKYALTKNKEADVWEVIFY